MKKFYELCPHCEQETKMVDFKVQKCEHCGRYVVPCAMCPIPATCKSCPENCPLSAFADELNKGIDFRMETIERMVEEFNCNQQEMDFRIKVKGNEHRFGLLNIKDDTLTLLYDKEFEGNSYVWYGGYVSTEEFCSAISAFVGGEIDANYKIKLKEKL